ncbi:MAG: Asp-tRNA(Asn)/Glu-tRNA(Gln) amidotransferase subunit GatC [Akkermansiaceae bacterium]|jgi:aspartyl-tRNA(Asn)/glutamyl-tRNA(Gln) amidotransferase subunit C|nr:Asp-tRNA(Asn)/Glu-tRNA(Gln) amidotransferase subunit GatC [Akkermansiaceae bacterium]MDP4647527.1 Asp-tRNA(Asn)/Glu-tRNA(Gln) amidotransferase subunit GatC [Akkermansiaceae bacterium]MDP4722472.1 Asp-tRNA(Asn)/Glu-tRNA(Gln) amidotransferase subunit GatC [Akkermansiaceae bacterium]MDP4778638.1 Asp-tRNA(Asn)/Glu-tRNA(Gln) amidotransferase subunit GatC [Akkermansiaceae bacterium]MDP4848313.1 Asp-tRNA(Asn)/Glu-tRNA(Gln) amidotransferase subunit GatC [Akkermansiaceae bacterium]
MSHDSIDVRYVAKLARLDLTEEEVTLFQSQLESILGHVESLTAIELPDDLENDQNSHLAIMRNDTPHESLDPELVLGNAPEQSQQQVRVPKVVADA